MDPGVDVEKIRPTQYEVAGDASDKGDVERSPEKETAERLDKSGLPLVPQPTAHRDDPLVSVQCSTIVRRGLTTMAELVSYPETARHAADQLAGHPRADGLGCGQPSVCDDGQGVPHDSPGDQLWRVVKARQCDTMYAN